MKEILDIDEGTVRRIDWQELLPGTMLLRAFSMALKVFPITILALFLSFCISLTEVDSGVRTSNADAVTPDANQTVGFSVAEVVSKFSFPTFPCWSECNRGRGASCCFDSLCSVGCDRNWIFGLTVFLTVFAFFWIMQARATAVRLASSERSGLFASMKFALESYSTLVAVVFLCLLTILFPYFLVYGLNRLDVWLDLTWLRAILLPMKVGFSFLFGLFLLLNAVAFPLMFSAIAVEKSDCYDAMARGYSYVLTRPLHYVVYLLIAAFFGLVGLILTALISKMTAICLSFGASSIPLDSVGWTTFWIRSIFLAPVAFALTFFITAENTIYFILRRSVDGTLVANFKSDNSHKPSRKLVPIAYDSVPGQPEEKTSIIGDAGHINDSVDSSVPDESNSNSGQNDNSPSDKAS